ncbi:MAG: type II toxin-antitoxin system death-on-curing family toxin [Candidatus Omnitrophota bacterium]|nr:type II toxin-antitoxin system death-on-curing family toxin [Candidatus Omnitrophota bacterium]
MAEPDFLTLAEVINFHADQIHRYGGSLGVRDLGLLESALAQPSASFGGEWLHRDLFEMAAAYAYHICQNHPFIDGNKRTALVCALVFLELNHVGLLDPTGRLKDAMLRVAAGQMNKDALATLFRTLPTESKK